MKKFRASVVLLAAFLMAVPAFPVSKEIIQLQTQVQALQDQMTQMRESFDERMGVMKNLIEQSTDNVNKVSAAVNSLNQQVQKSQQDTGTHTEQLSGQIQALNDSVDELKARLNKIGQQLDAMQNQQQNITPGTQPGGQPVQQAQPGSAPQAAVPPPDVIYNNALRDYNSGNYDIASQEFGDYLKYYQNTDLAGNAQFYLGDIDYHQGNFAAAIKSYDAVIQQYPDGNKAAAAQLKKGYALIELGQKQAAVRELNALITRYPRSIEAQQAKDRLRKLGSSTASKGAPHGY
ncbi:MAG TPA: tol-pal system protein YbgF [Terriglobales bacterium]|nr:tol-pal system protein YbgF [Terriglobales bacterium]